MSSPIAAAPAPIEKPSEREMMGNKILVIKPPYAFYPIGFAYVLSCLERHNIHFDFIDTLFGYDYKKLIKKNDYAAVATGGLVSFFKFYNEVVSNVKMINPQLPVIIGGNITKDVRPDFLLHKMGATYAVAGEAETSLPFLVDLILKKSDHFSDVPGLIFRDPASGEITMNPVRRLDLSVDNILPAWHHINIDHYIKISDAPFFDRYQALPVITARGCSGKCTFCSPSIGSLQTRPIDHIIQEIEYLNTHYDFSLIAFMNEMFFNTGEEIEQFCDAYRKIIPRKGWVCNLRVNAGCDSDAFRSMKSAGCVGVTVGIESGSDKVLKLMRKGTTVEMTAKFFRNAKAAGLRCSGTFMMGNEGENEADLKETIDFVIREEINGGDCLTLTYPGTAIYKNAVKRGLIADEWDNLQHLRFEFSLWDPFFTHRHYVNISDIPNDRFWGVITRESRRFYTFLLHHFQVKDLHYKFVLGSLLRVAGSCPDCGCRVTLLKPRLILGIHCFCPDCFRHLFFNFYELEEFENHFELLCDELSKAKSIAVFGLQYEALYLLCYDYFNLNYERIAGFIDSVASANDTSDFYLFPRLHMTDLFTIRPDAVLIADDLFGDAEIKLRHFYLQHDAPPPRILHLWPDAKRRKRFLTGIVKNFAGSNRPSKVFFFAIISGALALSSIHARLFNFNKLKRLFARLLKSDYFKWIASPLLHVIRNVERK
ncbi:MAG: radical SAM protein [Chitinispirillaceae bacterium]|nr:radical SAM protein [Chitinispirillaceae bacterium]